MRGFAIIVASILGLLCGDQPALAQKATEQYIPLGKSPGLSGKEARTGRITSADARRGRLEIEGSGGAQAVKVTKETRIWLDRSPLGMTNTRGVVADCREGRRVEVKLRDPERGEQAEWIKVLVEDGP